MPILPIFQARNLLRDHFRVGDLVLFYHSGDPKHMSLMSGGSIKEPGIAAVCVVSKVPFCMLLVTCDFDDIICRPRFLKPARH